MTEGTRFEIGTNSKTFSGFSLKSKECGLFLRTPVSFNLGRITETEVKRH